MTWRVYVTLMCCHSLQKETAVEYDISPGHPEQPHSQDSEKRSLQNPRSETTGLGLIV